MKNRMLFVVVAMMIVGASLLALAGPESKPAADAVPEFAGKILIVYCHTEGRQPPKVLSKPHFESVGNRLFLAGIRHDSKRANAWKTGSNINIPWDSVTSYFVFSPDEFAEFLAKNGKAG